MLTESELGSPTVRASPCLQLYKQRRRVIICANLEGALLEMRKYNLLLLTPADGLADLVTLSCRALLLRMGSIYSSNELPLEYGPVP